MLGPRRSFCTKNEFLSGLGCGGGLSERETRKVFSLLSHTYRKIYILGTAREAMVLRAAAKSPSLRGIRLGSRSVGERGLLCFSFLDRT
jgi:hypothetical protein